VKFSINILIDQFLTSTALKAIIKAHDNCVLLKDKNQGKSFWQNYLLEVQPDLIILDPQEHDGSFEETLKIIGILTAMTKVLIISDEENILRIKQLFELKVSGFLTKHCSADEIEKALSSIIDDKKFFCQEVLELIFNNKPSEGSYKNEGLSEREIEVLKLIGQGFTSKQIADQLFISIHTVNSHRKNLLKKLGMKSPTQLMVYAIEHTKDG